MLLTTAPEDDLQLDMELCRALFEKNPDRLIELVSEWLESNQLAPSEEFTVPTYLNEILSRADDASRTARPWGKLVS
ncbi:hypothetical protein [Roseibium aggregatum]|uniref:Uncharacterized protein n=1 Tax=Roseibium aggregatum TaxID=187304 RepID=A0A939EH93_9HYPH|nr:hypothetical protein [Roseibium aggregatum]MBN9673085.1 hypothetical protein [Roseibium aggregatum]